MSSWAVTAVSFLLLVTIKIQGQETGIDKLDEIEVTESSSMATTRLILVKRDAYLNQAYADTFAILGQKNSCSSFYGGPRAATTVLNSLITQVMRQPLLPEVTFQMSGRLTFIKDDNAGVYYRLFTETILNSNGSFYQRRAPERKLPPDIGGFAAGSRPLRALTLLHELGHLIRSDNGDWLIPDDGHNGWQSRINTQRVLQACQEQLEPLRFAKGKKRQQSTARIFRSCRFVDCRQTNIRYSSGAERLLYLGIRDHDGISVAPLLFCKIRFAASLRCEICV